MRGTILFGIDVESASDDTLAFVEHAGALFKELNVPATWFVTGGTLEKYPDVFRKVDGEGLIDLQGHTYSHLLLKTVLMQLPDGVTAHGSIGWHMVPGASPQEIDQDLARCQQVFRNVLGREATALTTPWAYYRGLGDRPDLLKIVHSHGFRALRSFGRNERDCQPVPLQWQPFFYKPQGFPDVLECLIHDYQDDFYWEMFAPEEDGKNYADHLRKVADRVAAENLTWSLCSHDHHWNDPESREAKLTWMKGLLEHAQALDMRFLTISEYYREMKG